LTESYAPRYKTFMPTKLTTPALFLITLSPVIALANASEKYTSELAQSVAPLVIQHKDSAAWLQRFETAFLKKSQGKGSSKLMECDVLPTCRPDRVLLFRGEGLPYPTPSTAGLMRTAMGKSEYVRNLDIPDIFGRLESDLKILRPFQLTLDDEVEITLVPAKGTKDAHWITMGEENEKTLRGQNARDGKGLSLTAMLFQLHKGGNFPHYRDPELKDVNLDPFASYTLSPFIALSFAQQEAELAYPLEQKKLRRWKGVGKVYVPPHFGQLLVLSVPEKEFVRDCGEKLPPVGAVLNPAHCGKFREFKELEYPVTLYPKPGYGIGRYNVELEDIEYMEAHQPKLD
jgi:hypothetical protein